jgi:hypothetical protein
MAMKRVWLILAALLGLAVQAVPASAAVELFTLSCTTVACTGAGAGNWGTVTLTESGSGSSAKVTVSVALASGFEFGDNGVGLNTFIWNGLLETDNLTITAPVSNASAFAVQGGGANGSYAAASPFDLSGNFDYAVNRSNNGGDPTTLSFDVSKSGGITIANFKTGNDGGGYIFGARLQPTGSSGNQDIFVVTQLPEPATWLLFFAALTGLTLLYRRRKLARA